MYNPGCVSSNIHNCEDGKEYRALRLYLPPEDTAESTVVLPAYFLHNLIHRPPIQLFIRDYLKRNPILHQAAMVQLHNQPEKSRNNLVNFRGILITCFSFLLTVSSESSL